jgi:hypothetical protein
MNVKLLKCIGCKLCSAWCWGLYLNLLRNWYVCICPVVGRLLLKRDGTRAETRFRLSAKRTSPFKSAGASVQSTTGSRGGSSAVVMLDIPCSEVVWRVLATHSIRQFPLHFPSRTSPCAVTFQLDSTTRPNVSESALFYALFLEKGSVTGQLYLWLRPRLPDVCHVYQTGLSLNSNWLVAITTMLLSF